MTAVRMNQCKACPWKKSTVPDRDIPGGYSAGLHEDLDRTIAEPASLRGIGGPMRLMACHETKKSRERACAGWVHNQLGIGNNIALRLMALRGDLGDLRSLAEVKLDGPQHERFEDTLPACARKT